MENLAEKINKGFKEIPLNNFSHKYIANNWKKNGKSRIYINRTNGRNQKSVGYIENNILVDNGLSYKAKEIIEKLI